MNAKIYLVEDEADIASLVADYLRAANMQVQLFNNGQDASDAIQQTAPNLVLLDIMLPGLDGLTVLNSIRQSKTNKTLPVIMMTARVEEIDRLLGLESGADDYICKPFSPRELVARVKSVLRRTQPIAEELPVLTDLNLDASSWQVSWHGQPVRTTRTEFMLLQVLAAQPGRIFSRQQLLDHVHPEAFDASERAIDSHIKNLRKKLNSMVDEHDWIRSVYGVGFSLEFPAGSA